MENVIFESSFRQGLSVFRGNEWVGYLPRLQWIDDPRYRAILEDGNLILQTFSWSQDDWLDLDHCGPFENLELVYNDYRL